MSYSNRNFIVDVLYYFFYWRPLKCQNITHFKNILHFNVNKFISNSYHYNRHII